jgi:tyrosinase
MTVSRRTVLLQGCVIGAGVIAANVPGISALAGGTQLPQRRSLVGLAWNDPIVATYRDAVGIMKQKPDSEKFSWVNLSSIHGTEEGGFHFCPHGDWYFLPWHRAYLVAYERIIRELTHNNDFALPYWDWTANPTMPEVFLEPKTPDGKKNWLYVDEPDHMRTWPPRKPMPDNIVGQPVLDEILASTTFDEFGTSKNPHQDSLDPSWIPKGGGIQGTLEHTPHNIVHDNISGWMEGFASPRDPIFYMHHGNIDRIWALWNHASTDSLWLDMPFTNNFYNVDGSFYSPKVSDLLVPEDLGYTYGLPAPAAFFAPPAVVALAEKLKTVYAAPGTASGAGIQTYVVQNTEPATPAKPLTLVVKADANLVTAVARREPVSSGADRFFLPEMRARAAAGTRTLAFIRDVAFTQHQNTTYRVFINCDYLSPETPTSDPHYVGAFGFFDHGGHGTDGAKPSFALDLTRAIQRVFGSEPSPSGQIQVQLLPVPNNETVGKAGTATPSRIEVVFVSA